MLEIGENKLSRRSNQYKEGIFFANSTNINGCMQRICPCEMWTNCRQYNNKGIKDLNPSELNIELHEWYQTHFRITYEHHDSFGNG
jgi:hypothetical protein